MKDLCAEPAFLRVFVGLAIGERLRAELAETQAALRRAEAHVSWTPPANLHVTLVFIGAIVPAAVAPLTDVLRTACAAHAAFRAAVAGVGWFGGGRPHVVWAGFAGRPQRLLDLQAALGENIRRLAYTLETRSYTPHLTLGRVRSSRGAAALVRAIGAVRERAFGVESFDRVTLYRSCARPGGSVYEILAECPLVPDEGAGAQEMER